MRMRLREHRLEAGLSQAELGRRCGLCKKTILSWERGGAPKSVRALAEMSSALGVPMEALLFHGGVGGVCESAEPPGGPDASEG